MSYKFQQVLRTNRDLTSENGTAIATGTRVVVMSVNEADNTVRVKVEDLRFPDLRKFRVVAGIDDVEVTPRGRPKGSGKSTPTE